MIKNQSLTLDCTALGADFEGICRHEGQVVFVPGALPGETVKAAIIKVTKAWAIGKLEAALTASPMRATPRCPVYPRCGGCTAQHLAYPATLRQKRQQVVDCLERIGGVKGPAVAETLGMDNPWRYRNKGAFPVGGETNRPMVGCFAARSHAIVDAPGGCFLQSEQSDALVRAVRRWMTQTKVPPYNEASHTGLIRHVMTRESKDGGAMLVIVANGTVLPRTDALITTAREAVPALRSVILSEQTKQTNVILGERFRTLWGEDSLEDTFAGFSMRVSPPSFFQVNRLQAERLVTVAVDFAGLLGDEIVWDVYCGAGAITLPLAKRARRVLGIEIVPEAIRDANENAQRNGVTNAMFLCAAAEDALPELFQDGAPDVVVLDPPRKGAEPAALLAIAKAAPRRIVYVSCNPATLSRDVKLLEEQGYAFVKAQPVDMFGWTGHVECVALLERADG